MQWADVLADSSLQDLPYKIELDEYGRIVMSPATNRHGELQGDLYFLLRRALADQGKPLVECSIETAKGVKVADVVALAGRAHIGARSAANARLRKLRPLGGIEEFFGRAAVESVELQIL